MTRNLRVFRDRAAQRFSGQVVTVVGASRGIGAAVASVLASEGASVVFAARSATELDDVCKSLRGNGPHLAIGCDVQDPESVRGLIGKIRDRFGKLDGLVFAAAVAGRRPLGATSEEEVGTVGTNLTGAVRCVRKANPLLTASRGAVVLVSSASARRGYPGLAIYSATKAGVAALAEALRVELRDAGIRVSVVVPRRTRTG